MKITEILRLDNFDKPSTGMSCPSFDVGLHDTWNLIKNHVEIRPIPFVLKTRVFKAGEDNYYIFAFERACEHPSLILEISNYYDGFAVNNIRIEPSLRGNHYGMKLYLAITDFCQKPLYSGAQQTTASNNAIWKKLIEQYPNRVVGFDQRSRTDLKLKLTARGIAVRANEPVYIDLPAPKYNYSNTRGMAIRTRLLKLLPH